MEEACHEMDLRLASQTGSQGSIGGVSFESYVGVLHQLFSLKEESEKQTQVVALLEQLVTYLALTLPEDSPAVDQVRTEARDQRKLLQNVVNLHCGYRCTS